jgi:hypothetical protein
MHSAVGSAFDGRSPSLVGGAEPMLASKVFDKFVHSPPWISATLARRR